ncbi:MAG: competence/damage-inducible protein A [Verrucomicrobiales bacterium]|nr:competence/damage-inducible protein A [Verrucomicrobiales bacterium]
MRIEVVNTGTELLLGKVVNTHASYFGQELFKLGLRVQRQTTIPDGEEIRTVLENAFPRCDAILITGGLGPTNDDMTREVVAEMLGRTLHLDEDILETINEMFRSRGLKQNRSNDRQAMVPEGAEVLQNPHGTAPGLYLPATAEEGSTTPHLFLLPGPPRELKPMFAEEVVPRLSSLRDSGDRFDIWHNFRIYGVGESSLASKLEPLLEPIEDLELGYCARLGEVDLRLIGPSAAIETASEIIRAEYAEDIIVESEESIEEVVQQLLAERGETVSTAESCTGGNIASTITNASGSSSVFRQGYVTYANEAKQALLGVSAETLEAHGAVSEPVVREMAEGCLRVSGADHAVAVSGIAGPTGGTEEKPVGTVYVGIASREGETFAKRYFTPSDRVSFKLRVTRLALDLLRRRLRGFSLD